MTTTLTYGENTNCLLEDVEAQRLSAGSAQTIPIDEIAAAVQSQLASPNDFPPLAQATIPGDSVVVAAESNVPQLASLLDGALRSLYEAGTNPAQTTILIAGSGESVDCLKAELAEIGHECDIQRHDPDHEKEIAFLGISQADLAIRLNRLLCDADFVLPIAVTNANRFSKTAGTKFTGLYPIFSDSETMQRIATESTEHFPGLNSETQQELADCHGQLGVQLTLQVVPGANEQIAQVLAGEANAVARQADEQYQQTWQTGVSQRARLAIATITGKDQQTWQNIARSLVVADSILVDEGAIVVCSELEEPVGAALGLLATNEDPLVIERELQRTPDVDCGAAMTIGRILQRHAIYLRSRLKPSLVESLGLSPIESDQEIERLTQSLRPCAVLEDAQWLLPVVESSEDADAN